MGCLALVCLLSGGIMNGQVAASQAEPVPQSGENTVLPIVVASGYSVVDGVVAAGEKFTLGVHIENVNRYVGAYHVQATVYSQTQGVYLQQGETNQRYLEYLPPGGSYDFLINMETAEGVQSDAANISIQFNYVNESGYSGSNATSITPIIRKKCDLKVLSLTVVNDATIGAKALFNMRYKNAGEVSIKNPKLRIEGNIDKNGQDISLNAPEIDRQEYLDLQIAFTEVGHQELKIYISYEDEEGNLYEIEPRQVFTLVKGGGYNSMEEKTEEQTVIHQKRTRRVPYTVLGVMIMIGILLAFLSEHFWTGMKAWWNKTVIAVRKKSNVAKTRLGQGKKLIGNLKNIAQKEQKIKDKGKKQAKRMAEKLMAMVRKAIGVFRKNKK